MFLALLRTHFIPRYARTKMSFESGQKHIYAREHQLYCYIIPFVQNFYKIWLICRSYTMKCLFEECYIKCSTKLCSNK